MKKRAIFFSTDALIALIIILLTILTVYPIMKYSKYSSEIESDILTVLSSLKIGEIDDSYVQSLISQGKINDLNKNILKQIGEFYVTDINLARELANSILNYLDTNQNIGIWYGTDLLASTNSTPFETAENIETSRQIISGIKNGSSVTGFSSRAYLINGLQNKYFYFGGYIGEGNITAKIEYTGTIEPLAEMELVITEPVGDNLFQLYINGVFVGDFATSQSEFIPITHQFSTADFHSGENSVEIKGEDLYIAGGYIKIIYEDSVQYEQPTKHFFPGVNGIINIYDGFYVPNNLNSLEIFLHLDTSYITFLTIGNTIVFRDSTSGEETISITNSELSSLLDYSDLSSKTIPIRLGMENVSYTSNITLDADVFSVTDLSGSMKDTCNGGGFFCCFFHNFCSTEEDCQDCGGIWEAKLSIVKDANKAFIDGVLNYSGNRVGLVGYRTAVSDSDCHELSDDDESLKSEVDSWSANGRTCICCGINKAVNDLLADSDETKVRSIVVMSDGEANERCVEQGYINPTQDAIKAACDAYQNHGIIVHAIGFGDDAEEETLQEIATCGNGSYYYGSLGDIVDIYRSIAQEIIEAAYNEQRIEAIGNISTKLYSDSYIEFDYTTEPISYGLITTFEKQFDDEYSGSFYVPPDSQILDAKAISYSGPRWTDYVWINNSQVYNLASYGEDYIQLGDPYAINIPNSLVTIGGDNIVNITTGLSPSNSTSGSQYNKIIYTTLRNITSYSPISILAEGCIWHIQFEDNTNMTATIPGNYSGTDNCYYTPTSRIYDNNDAIQTSVYYLFQDLDIDSDYRVDVKFQEQDLQITSSTIIGIPFTWSTEVQVRKWY